MASSGVPRTAVVLSLLSLLGVAVAAGMAWWTANNTTTGLTHVAAVANGVFIVLGVLSVSLLPALVSLGMAIFWRRAGGRGWLSVLTISLSALASLVVVVSVTVLVVGVILVIRVLGEI